MFDKVARAIKAKQSDVPYHLFDDIILICLFGIIDCILHKIVGFLFECDVFVIENLLTEFKFIVNSFWPLKDSTSKNSRW